MESMLTRRGFLAGAAGALASFRNDSPDLLERALKTHTGEPEDEDFWYQVRAAFTLDPNFVNFNNGGCSPCPRIAQDAVKRAMDYGNQAPSYYMWQHLEPEREAVRKRLAALFHVSAEEVAITRNASESLEILLMGFDLQPGDEVLASRLDYPRMLGTLKSRERRHGIKLVQVESALPRSSRDDLQASLLEGYSKGITNKTKMILVSQTSFMNGQQFPIEAIVNLGKKHGIPVIVDGAHAFAQYDFDQRDLTCEFYGASLHKWLMAPMGTGLLYVKKERIPEVWPLMAAAPTQDADIRKFEEIGTHQAAIVNAIGESLTFHEMIGAKRKEARFRYLRKRWTDKLADVKTVNWFTSLNPKESCALTTVGIKGIKTADLHTWLLTKRGIYTTTIVNDFIDGLRITPNVYATVDEVDRLGDALHEAATQGIA